MSKILTTKDQILRSLSDDSHILFESHFYDLRVFINKQSLYRLINILFNRLVEDKVMEQAYFLGSYKVDHPQLSLDLVNELKGNLKLVAKSEWDLYNDYIDRLNSVKKIKDRYDFLSNQKNCDYLDKLEFLLELSKVNGFYFEFLSLDEISDLKNYKVNND